MIPISDTEQNRYSFFPIMTLILIVVNCCVYYLELFVVGEDYWPFFMKYAATPRLILSGQGSGALSNVTAMFLHGSFFHLVGNMLALWVFGRRVEDACGPWRFLAFYLLAGTWAHILFVLVQRDSPIPGIGASGAIFGVMGAYLLLFPEGRIRTLVLISFIPLVPRIRAIWIVLYLVGIQIIPAIQVLLRKADYSVNHWAHLGGFFSAVFILLFIRPEAFARYLSDTPVQGNELYRILEDGQQTGVFGSLNIDVMASLIQGAIGEYMLSATVTKKIDLETYSSERIRMVHQALQIVPT